MAGFSRPRCERYIEKLRGLEMSIINAEAQTASTPPVMSDYCRQIIGTMDEIIADQKVFAQAIWTYKATFDEALRKLGGDKASRNQGLQAMKEALHNMINYAQNWLGTNTYALVQEEDFPSMNIGRALLDQVSQKVNETQSNTLLPPRVEGVSKQPKAQDNDSVDIRKLREQVGKLQNDKQILQTQLDMAKTKLQSVELKFRNALENYQGIDANRLNAEQQLRRKDAEIDGLRANLDKLMADKATLIGEMNELRTAMELRDKTIVHYATENEKQRQQFAAETETLRQKVAEAEKREAARRGALLQEDLDKLMRDATRPPGPSETANVPVG